MGHISSDTHFFQFDLVREPGAEPLLVGSDGLKRALRALRQGGVPLRGTVSIVGRTTSDGKLGQTPGTTVTIGLKVDFGTSQEAVRSAIQSVLADLRRPDVTVRNA